MENITSKAVNENQSRELVEQIIRQNRKITVWSVIPFLLSFIALCLLVQDGLCQDTLALSLPQADSIFLHNNLYLLSQQYNIEASEALILQAHAYPNPNFIAEVNSIDRENGEVFHVDKTGQKAFTLEQLIILGGKRRTEIDIAKQNNRMAQFEFTDLLRNLQLELHNSFFKLREQRNILEKYNRQLGLLDTLILSYDVQAKRGNVPMKDAIRLKSVYLKINNEKAMLAALHTDETRKMQLLIQSNNYILPTMPVTYFDQLIITMPYDELLELAISNRPDLKIAAQQSELSALNLRLQRKMAIPNVIAFTSYDQRGGAFLNQINTGLGIPLPLWDRNRGNIKAAGFYQKSAITYHELKRMMVETEVQAAWTNLIRSANEYAKVKNIYTEDFDQVFQGVNANFRKRNITILEFVDFFEAYNESLTEFERVKTQLAIATRQINYVTGSRIF